MLRVDPHSDVPPSKQLVRAVLDAIASGELASGDRLPSVRAAAAEALVNPNTIGKAWRELENLGAVEGRNGSGVFVTPAGPDIARAERLTRTLDDFKAAALAALTSGHAIELLSNVLEDSANSCDTADAPEGRTS